MVKPFITFSIERYSDVAMVTIVRITDDGQKFHREVLEQFETLGKGATASARRSIKVIEKLEG